MRQIFLIFVAVVTMQANAKEFMFWRAEYAFFVSKNGDFFDVRFEHLFKKKPPFHETVRFKEENGYLILELSDMTKLSLSPHVFDDTKSYQERSQFKRQIPIVTLPDGHTMQLVYENNEQNNISVEEPPLPKNFSVQPGALIIRDIKNLQRRDPEPVLAVRDNEYFTVRFDISPLGNEPIKKFGYLKIPNSQYQVLNPMKNPPYEKVLEAVTTSQASQVLGYVAHDVLSVIQPIFNHHEVWYWVITTTGKVLTVNGSCCQLLEL